MRCLLPFELGDRRLTRIPNEEQFQQSTQFEGEPHGFMHSRDSDAGATVNDRHQNCL
jgi:hypothetical protein